MSQVFTDLGCVDRLQMQALAHPSNMASVNPQTLQLRWRVGTKPIRQRVMHTRLRNRNARK